jgi:signal transduction histidine kinase
MTLRRRLALAVVAAIAPVVLGLLWFDAVVRHRTSELALAGLARAHLQPPDARARCEADPANFGGALAPPDGPEPHPDDPHRPSGPALGSSPDRPGDPHRPHGPPDRARPGGPPPGPPPRLFAYDAALRPAHPDAPVLDPGQTTDDILGLTAFWHTRVDVLVRTPWTGGACQYVLIRGSTARGWHGAVVPSLWIWFAPVLVVFAAVLLAVGPVVARIRRLTAAVERSASAGYSDTVPVEGRDELAALARAFAAAGREVRTQLAEKDRREDALRRFLADTTHDVMIPLTVLQGHLSALRERLADADPTLVAAMHEAHYLAALVHNLGAAARLDSAAPQLHRAPVDLAALVDRVLARHRPIARPLAVALEGAPPDAPVLVDADATLLEQAVSNVVYNAVRHNRPGGHVAVLLETTAPDRFRLRVVDDGPGLPPEQLARIAERGFRSDAARTRAPDGQGLGLDIAARVAALHGLTLRFAASEYGGLQVDLEGPCAP